MQPDAAKEHVLVGGDDDDDDALIEARNKIHVPIVDLRQSNTKREEDERTTITTTTTTLPPLLSPIHGRRPHGALRRRRLHLHHCFGSPRCPNCPADAPPHHAEIRPARDWPRSQDGGPLPYFRQTRNSLTTPRRLWRTSKAAEDLRRAQWGAWQAFVRAERIERGKEAETQRPT